MSQKEDRCTCSPAPKLVFACSGAADVGELADRAARQLSKTTQVKMYCLAGVGGRVEPIMDTVDSAGYVTAIDGCSLDCARHTLDRAGFSEFKHIRLTDLGFEKGKTPPTAESIQRVVDVVQQSF